MKWQRDHTSLTFELLDDSGHLAATVEQTSRRDPKTHELIWGWGVWDRSGQEVALAPNFEEATNRAEEMVRGT